MRKNESKNLTTLVNLTFSEVSVMLTDKKKDTHIVTLRYFLKGKMTYNLGRFKILILEGFTSIESLIMTVITQ